MLKIKKKEREGGGKSANFTEINIDQISIQMWKKLVTF